MVDLQVTLVAIAVAVIFWELVSVWDAFIDSVVYPTMPWPRGSWQAELTMAVFVTIIVLLIVAYLEQNFGDFMGIDLAKRLSSDRDQSSGSI